MMKHELARHALRAFVVVQACVAICAGPFMPYALAQQSAQAPAAPQRESYVIGKGDVVEVSVLGRTDYTSRVQVQDDGTVMLPLISALPAAGRTVLALRDEITNALSKGGYFEKPAINVSVVSYASRYVTVLGQVNTPGIVPIDRAYRLSEVLARAGGLADPSASSVTLTRLGAEPQEYTISELATGGANKDPVVSDGDKVFVAPAKTFYIYGAVNAPKTAAIEPDLTVRKALVLGGGLTALGSERSVKLIRGTRETKIKDLSTPVLPGDVIVVGERFF
jgi:polysaccharide export outer membrane protein